MTLAVAALSRSLALALLLCNPRHALESVLASVSRYVAITSVEDLVAFVRTAAAEAAAEADAADAAAFAVDNDGALPPPRPPGAFDPAGTLAAAPPPGASPALAGAEVATRPSDGRVVGLEASGFEGFTARRARTERFAEASARRAKLEAARQKRLGDNRATAADASGPVQGERPRGPLLAGLPSRSPTASVWRTLGPTLVRLDLSFNGLAGPVPVAGLAALGQLRSLHLQGNAFSGPLPACCGLTRKAAVSGGRCPLRRLTELDLSFNHLSGTLAPLAGAPRLATLWLDGNRLSGGLGALVPFGTTLPRLEALGLRGNRLSGTLAELVDDKAAAAREARAKALAAVSAAAAAEAAATGKKVGRQRDALGQAAGSAAGSGGGEEVDGVVLLRLPRLTSLDVRDNRLRGDLPPHVVRLCQDAKLRHLRVLQRGVRAEVEAALAAHERDRRRGRAVAAPPGSHHGQDRIAPPQQPAPPTQMHHQQTQQQHHHHHHHTSEPPPPPAEAAPPVAFFGLGGGSSSGSTNADDEPWFPGIYPLALQLSGNRRLCGGNRVPCPLLPPTYTPADIVASSVVSRPGTPAGGGAAGSGSGSSAPPPPRPPKPASRAAAAAAAAGLAPGGATWVPLGWRLAAAGSEGLDAACRYPVHVMPRSTLLALSVLPAHEEAFDRGLLDQVEPEPFDPSFGRWQHYLASQAKSRGRRVAHVPAPPLLTPLAAVRRRTDDARHRSARAAVARAVGQPPLGFGVGARSSWPCFALPAPAPSAADPGPTCAPPPAVHGGGRYARSGALFEPDRLAMVLCPWLGLARSPAPHPDGGRTGISPDKGGEGRGVLLRLQELARLRPDLDAFWFEYWSLPQKRDALVPHFDRTAALASVPFYALCCGHFIVLDPDPPDPGPSEDDDDDDPAWEEAQRGDDASVGSDGGISVLTADTVARVAIPAAAAATAPAPAVVAAAVEAPPEAAAAPAAVAAGGDGAEAPVEPAEPGAEEPPADAVAPAEAGGEAGGEKATATGGGEVDLNAGWDAATAMSFEDPYLAANNLNPLPATDLGSAAVSRLLVLAVVHAARYHGFVLDDDNENSPAFNNNGNDDDDDDEEEEEEEEGGEGGGGDGAGSVGGGTVRSVEGGSVAGDGSIFGAEGENALGRLVKVARRGRPRVAGDDVGASVWQPELHDPRYGLLGGELVAQREDKRDVEAPSLALSRVLGLLYEPVPLPADLLKAQKAAARGGDDKDDDDDEDD